MRRTPSVRILLFMLLILTGAVGAVSALEIKIASIAPENSPYGVALNQMASEWQQITGGRVRVIIYHNGIAGDQSDVLRKMRIGQLQGGVFTNTAIASIVPEVLSISVPFLVRNDDEFRYVMKDLKPILDRKLQSQGFTAIAWAEAGWVRFFSKDPLSTPQQLKADRLAVPPEQQDLLSTFKILGYKPIPLDMPETLSALNSGLVDVIFTSPLIVAGYQWFTAARYMLDMNIAPAVGTIVLSSRAWNQIPQQYREQLRASADRAGQKVENGILKLEADAISAMKGYGLKITEVTPQIRAEWEKEFQLNYNSIIGPVFDPATVKLVQDDLKAYRNK
ncbi:TRAP transporter substrate-binding protein [Salinispira pacifica]